MQNGNLSQQLSKQTPVINLSSQKSLMTMQEAKECIHEIKKQAQKIRALLLDLDERKGWKALGYKSLRQCMMAEFGKSQSQLYRELKAGKVQKIISHITSKKWLLLLPPFHRQKLFPLLNSSNLNGTITNQLINDCNQTRSSATWGRNG